MALSNMVHGCSGSPKSQANGRPFKTSGDVVTSLPTRLMSRGSNTSSRFSSPKLDQVETVGSGITTWCMVVEHLSVHGPAVSLTRVPSANNTLTGCSFGLWKTEKTWYG